MYSRSKTTPKPTSLLALVCLGIVHRLRPAWIAIPLSEAAHEEGVSSQYLSRLVSRAIEGFERVLANLTRIGRPRRDNEADKTATELALLRALLDVATSVLAQLPLQIQAIQDLVVGAYERLSTEHPTLTLKRYTEALGIPQRTFWDWRKSARTRRSREAPLLLAPPQESPPRKRPLRRPRFGFEVTLPDTQTGADTTDLCAFNVPLKLMAAQDIGGRDADLFDGVIVDDRESAERIVELLTETLSGREGEQAITDQGTPYMAKALGEALEELGAEHAPQREADPLGKATVERAFGTVKQIARPLLDLTNAVARAFPWLAQIDLAKAWTTLVLAMLLRAYQAGARAARRAIEARGTIAIEDLAEAAEETRERARAQERSARLLLSHLHEAYDLPGSRDEFVRVFRRYPLPVLHEADQAFAAQAHRDDITDRWAYFAAIVRRLGEEYRNHLARERAERAAAEARQRETARHEAEMEGRSADPVVWLREALEWIACQWIPERDRLLFDGVGAGTGWMRGAVKRLVELHGVNVAIDMARGALQGFANDSINQIGKMGIDAVSAVLENYLAEIPTEMAKEDFAPGFAEAIL